MAGRQEEEAPGAACSLLCFFIAFRFVQENFNKSLKNAHMASLLIDWLTD